MYHPIVKFKETVHLKSGNYYILKSYLVILVLFICFDIEEKNKSLTYLAERLSFTDKMVVVYRYLMAKRRYWSKGFQAPKCDVQNMTFRAIKPYQILL